MLNKLTFESQGLNVDYVTFNFDHLNQNRKTDLINYFYKLGFNSYETDRKYRNAFDEPIKHNFKNLYQIKFIKNINTHWKGIAVAFPDDSGAYFYKLAKNKQIQWDLFNYGLLSRLDLNYLRPLQSHETHSVTQFLRNSHEEITRKRINAKLESSLNNQILKIASRRSSRCARIYTTHNSLKFEIELRNNLIKNYNYLLVEGCFEQLESELVQEYISYFGKLLPFQYLYTDWLAHKLRPFRLNLKTYSQTTLCSDYINTEFETIFASFQPKKFLMFLEFLKFTKSLHYKTEIFDGDYYRIIIFRVKDFLDVSHSYYNSQNEYYKIQKTKDFLQDLQQNLFVKCFTDDYFKKPVFIKNYPKDIKAFYMYQNDDDKTVAAMDLLLPGIGEVIGGSQREHRLDKLNSAIDSFDIDRSHMEFYLDTRRFGTVKHSGFGLGLERVVQIITGMENIRDVIPFPRTPKGAPL